MFAIMCHSWGQADLCDVKQLCELSTLANYTRLFEDETPDDAEVRELTVMTHDVMARRLPEMLRALGEPTSPT